MSLPKITEADIEARRELIANEMETREQFASDMDTVAHNAEAMMNAIGEREGVDMRDYDINWSTGKTRAKDIPDGIQRIN